MSDIDREKQASAIVRLTNSDETLEVDIVEQFGEKKLVTKSDVIIQGANFRIIENTTPLSFPLNVWTNVYSSTGPSAVGGMMVDFDTNKVRIRLTVDNTVVFNVGVENLATYVNWNNSNNPPTTLSWNAGSNIFYFNPQNPLVSNLNFELDVQSTQGTRSLNGYYLETR